MIYARMARHLRGKDFPSVTAYLDHLDRGASDAELQSFINVLTTNLTSFFRERHHFDHLETHVLAPLKARPGTRLRIWSAGCSSGEEAYSIALTLRAALGRIPPDARILATDLDTNMLDRGRGGCYPADRLDTLPPALARGLPKPDQENRVTLPAELRNAIAFRRLNLLESWPMSGAFQAIFCRNVMIYFDAALKARLIDRFADVLTPDGILYLGHSESILGEHPKLISCGDTIYRRREAA
jgi:chemotaxis protein methyltransferase CheR